MKYLLLILLVAVAILPQATPVLAAGWGDGGCGVGLTPAIGQVGSVATLSIQSKAFPIDGEYQLIWSPTADFLAENCTIVKKGEVPPQGMQVIDSFVIPEARYGLNYVRFYRYKRPDDTPVNLSFTVTPKLEVIPAQSPPGAKVTVRGTGFPAESGGSITFDGKPTTLEIVPNKVGTFTAEFIIPTTVAGDVHKFVASSPKIFGEVVVANLKVAAGVSIEPANPDVGSEVKIIGSGFAAKSPVKIKYDNVNIANSPLSDENGNFSYSFKLPESNTPDHKFTIEDAAGNSFELKLKLENSAPPKPTTISPKADRFGWMGDQDVTFTWSPVSDPSGVLYTIEVAEDLNFFPLKPGMKKTGLTQTSCTINIKTGTYYWRVQAIDGAGNAGEWAISPYAFNVGFFSTWMLAIAGIICLVVFILLIRAFFQRLREYD